MKSRQKGKKKGSSKERVFGCDLREHLLQSGQEGKEAIWTGHSWVGGLPSRHQACLLRLNLACWAESASRGGAVAQDHHPGDQCRKCGLEKAPRFASVREVEDGNSKGT